MTKNSMKLIPGNTFADKIVNSIKKKVTSYHQQGLTTPHLAAVRVGQNPSSEIYVRRKASACKHVGIATSIHHLPEGAEGGDVRALLEELSADRWHFAPAPSPQTPQEHRAPKSSVPQQRYRWPNRTESRKSCS